MKRLPGKTEAGARLMASESQALILVERSAPSWVSAIRATILSIPRGKVSTYGEVAEAAGYPGYHRQVAQVLNRSGHGLPWYRVLGAGGRIKTSLDTALDQRTRLEMEGVKFKGRRVDLAACAYQFAITKNRRLGK